MGLLSNVKKAERAAGVTGVNGLASLDEATILKNMSDPPDQKRKQEMDKLAQQAAAGDATALLRLQALSGLDAKKEGLAADPYADLRGQFKSTYGTSNPGAATADAQNYARSLVANLTGQPAAGYLKPKDAYMGDDIGKVLKIAAPIAGALIPGVGTLGAAAIGGVGNAAGQYAATGKIDPKQAVLSGAAAAAGNKALGNGLGSTIPKAPDTSWLAGANQGAAEALGGLPGAASTAAGAAGAAGQAGSSLLGIGADDLKKWGPLVLGGLGAIDSASQSAQADKLRSQGLQYATQDYNSRAPVRAAALTGALAPLPQQKDLSQTLVNRANPYSTPAGGRI